MTAMFGAKSGLHLGLLSGALLITLECGSKLLVVLAVCIAPLLLWFGALPIWFDEPLLFHNASPELLNLIYMSNVGNLIKLVLLSDLIILRRTERAEEALSWQYKRSESFLANLLPNEVAERLKRAPGKVIADEIPALTILFADIVGLTQRAEKMMPEELVAFLNRIFSAFDDLTAKNGLEKIKTVGDTYMVAGGMPVERPNYAQAVANMALEMLEVVKRMSAEADDPIEIRIGLHTGAAVAGVIGSDKVFYDVWGDTVNTAARTESHGEAGRIQVTDATRSILEQDYFFEPRGKIDIKGKG